MGKQWRLRHELADKPAKLEYYLPAGVDSLAFSRDEEHSHHFYFFANAGSVILFTFPAFWSPPVALPVALPRLAGIWGGVINYFTFLQQPSGEKETITLLYLLAAAAMVECALSLAGFYCPQYLPSKDDLYE
ncbi:hypothetical protein [Siccibacter colletis]|uniref:Uncharacterized protein n=1 Tax=Siccibacter colletis TaxID=1505757 RepID=A0ABY6JGZ5_9ENTR|nr:hypothetical protein [Siccibacter colletis]UYU32723.1 hypothetical protein KFZ77_04175 [Siccibacter colletis]